MSKHEVRGVDEYPVKWLYPHPNNPRNDIGDISELTESIKANGLYQPLTIILGGPGLPKNEDGYTVIIGHRRLAAAKAAGLESVPCILVKMDEKEQVATMLLENMQRCDLTVYEQAQGFQMMLDLGETEQSIAEKTGFSKTTIKHRIKLLELDLEEFRKAEERQPKMSDYFQLEKLSDPELKKKALSKIGTDNFNWTLESCLRRQREKTLCGEWIKYIDSLFVRVDYDPQRKIVKTVMMTKKITDEDKAELDELEESDTLFTLDYCYTEGNTYAYILGGKRNQPVSTYEEEQKKKQARIGRIKEIQSQAQALRRKFVEEYKPKSNNRALMLRALLAEEVGLYDVNWNEVAGILGLPGPKEDDYYTAYDITEQSDFIMLCVNAPDKVLLTVLADYMEDCNFSVYNWEGKYQYNEGLERWYTVLRNIGYRISDEETQLLDGTHECFKEVEENG